MTSEVIYKHVLNDAPSLILADLLDSDSQPLINALINLCYFRIDEEQTQQHEWYFSQPGNPKTVLTCYKLAAIHFFPLVPLRLICKTLVNVILIAACL